MKKLLLLLAAVAMVVAFSMPAAAAEYVGHQACCENCDKCDLDDIYCPSSSTNQSDACDYFDYDTPYGATGAFRTGAFGYNGNNENCKVIFDICCCDAEAIAYFTVGQTIGIRMTSLTDGFYFTNDTIYIDIYEPDDDSLCLNPIMVDAQAFPSPYTYKNAAGTVITFADKSSTECTVPSVKKAVLLESVKGTGYVITQQDYDSSRCMWWFDMPAMRYDIDDATRGARVNVKIELLSAVSGICGDWKVICECIVDLGVWCLEYSTDPCCRAFPYVLTQTTGWTSGITLSNMGPAYVPYDEMVATLILTDKLGVTSTYEKTFASDEYVWLFTLDGILDQFDVMPAPGPASLKIYINFQGDAYLFLSNGDYAGGTHSTQCRDNCKFNY